MCLGRKDRILGALGRGKYEGMIAWRGAGGVNIPGDVRSKEVEADPLAFETCTGCARRFHVICGNGDRLTFNVGFKGERNKGQVALLPGYGLGTDVRLCDACD